MTQGLEKPPVKRSVGKAASIALALGSAITLQGCVAAAFPLAAGGLLGERAISRSGDDQAEPDPKVEVATASREEEVTNSDLAPMTPEPEAAVPPPTTTSADFNDAFAQSASKQSASTQSLSGSASGSAINAPAEPSRVVRPLPTPVPSARAAVDPATLEPAGSAPSGPGPSGPGPSGPASSGPASSGPIPSGPAPSGLDSSGINQLLSYANNRQIGTDEQPSAAMLIDRVTLEPVKAQCGGVSPTILIDLDPDGALFDSKTASRPPSGLARGLAQLRESGVGVAWISGNGIDKLDAIKRALRFSGLDLNNEDRVLLIRTPDDRKQTLREELSQISCLTAIAGDTRSDFDELYDYLKNPSDAQSLEPLIGDGWFLIPQPLL